MISALPGSCCYYAMSTVFLDPHMPIFRVLVPGSILIPVILKWHTGSCANFI